MANKTTATNKVEVLDDIKLIYFNGRGRAEGIRWVLSHAGVKFEDKRVAGEEWQALKPDSPTGKLPLVEFKGRKLAGSIPISTYIAKQYGLMGKDDWEAARIGMYLDLVQDTIAAKMKFFFDKDEAKKAELKKEYNTNQLADFVGRVSKASEEGEGWLVGNKISLADIVVAVFMDAETLTDKGQVTDPGALRHMNRVKDMPNIKTWIKSRPETPF